jgi:hypothetical protein
MSGLMPETRVPSAIYEVIWRAVRQKQQITFVYGSKPREACPIILGYSKSGDETVFAFQFAGGTSKNSPLPQWRCFLLAGIGNLQTRSGRWHEGGSHKQDQTCVQFVDVDVNIATSLTRARPLQFGSKELLPPRQKM